MPESDRLPFCLGVMGGPDDLDALCLDIEDRDPDSQMIAWSRSEGRGYRLLVLALVRARKSVSSRIGVSYVSVPDALEDMKDPHSTLITHSTAAEAEETFLSWSMYEP